VRDWWGFWWLSLSQKNKHLLGLFFALNEAAMPQLLDKNMTIYHASFNDAYGHF